MGHSISEYQNTEKSLREIYKDIDIYKFKREYRINFHPSIHKDICNQIGLYQSVVGKSRYRVPDVAVLKNNKVIAVVEIGSKEADDLYQYYDCLPDLDVYSATRDGHLMKIDFHFDGNTNIKKYYVLRDEHNKDTKQVERLKKKIKKIEEEKEANLRTSFLLDEIQKERRLFLKEMRERGIQPIKYFNRRK